jgi:hypothetical protein
MDAKPRKGDPQYVEAGREGARRRWGPPRVIRLDKDDPATAEAIRQTVAAIRAARSVG